ncbi:MAG: hypothetical protein AB8A32_09325 [Prochlorococcus sp.]
MKFQMLLFTIFLLLLGGQSHAGVRKHCDESPLYDKPMRNAVDPAKSILPAFSAVSASHVIHQGRNPSRISGWVEVYVGDGRSFYRERSYWMKAADCECGEWIGR